MKDYYHRKCKVIGLLLSLVLGLNTNELSAQDQDLYASPPIAPETPAIQSPNAASLGRYGEIPVSPFIGTPLVSVPIGEIKNGSITVPISLNYDAQGCKPEQLPTWVGLNWNLQAGGIIRRQTNANFDECIQVYTAAGYPLVNPPYYDNYSGLSANDWKSHSGNQFAPDEFNFSINGISGSFLMDHNGKWVVKSKSGNTIVKVEHTIERDYIALNWWVARAFTGFTLTDNMGFIYEFGKNHEAIEFNELKQSTKLESYNDVTYPLYVNPYYDAEDLRIARYTTIQSSAWHISKITAPSGETVVFNYTTVDLWKPMLYTNITPDPTGSIGDHVGLTISDLNQTNKYVVQSGFLSEIVASNGIVCRFTKSDSDDLEYPYIPKEESLDMPNGKPGVVYSFKLDKLEMFANNTKIKNVEFDYINNPRERLKLRKVIFKSSTDQKDSEFSFEYNTLPLPNYASAKEDHWGYYNGRDFFNGASQQGYPLNFDTDDYFRSREPVAAFLQAELLIKMTYPTKGYSQFYYEPHDCSKIVRQQPSIHLENLSYNKTVGGCRIKKIDTYDGVTSTPMTKEFFYTKNFLTGGGSSSGVLAGEPVYYEAYDLAGPAFYHSFTSAPLNNLNTTNGNHITYTEVTEKSNDGYTVYTFTNQDNGHMDTDPFAYKNRDYGVKDMVYKKYFGKMDLERGLPLSTKYYTSQKTLVKEISNQYNDDPNRFNQYVRSAQAITNGRGAAMNIILFPIYTFFPYLKSTTTTEYYKVGPALSTTKTFTYEPTYRLLRSISEVNSKGENVRTEHKYPFDFEYYGPRPMHPETAGLLSLVGRNMLGYPIETITKRNGKISKVTVNLYQESMGAVVPSRFYETELSQPIAASQYKSPYFVAGSSNRMALTLDPLLKTKVSYYGYDEQGNVGIIERSGARKTCYLWDYNRSLLVAEVTDATREQVAFTSFEADVPSRLDANNNYVMTNASTYGWQYDPRFNQATHLQTSGGVTGSHCYKLDGGWGVSRSLIPPGEYDLSFWAEDGYQDIWVFLSQGDERLSWTEGPRNAQGYHLVQARIRINGGSAASPTGSINIDAYGRQVKIDEVRLVPAGRHMTTHTHQVGIGATSTADANSQPTYFEYDTMSRLHLVKDHQGNILKRIQYNYKP